MLESYHRLQTESKTVLGFKDALELLIRSALPEKAIDNAVKNYYKRLQA